MTWVDLFAFCKWSPPGSALFEAINPDYVDVDTHMLNSIEFSLRWLRWAKTEDGAKGRNRPEPIPIGPQPKPLHDYTPMTADEMDAFLGWSPRELQGSEG